MHGKTLASFLTFKFFESFNKSRIFSPQPFERPVLIHLVAAVLDVHVEVLLGVAHDDVTDS